MKNLLSTLLVLVLLTGAACAQKPVDLDKSPLDVAYFPNGFAHDRGPGDKAVLKITYSRPQAKGREIFGKLIPYNKVWRTGANEATEIKIYQDIQLNGKNVKAGTYSLFTIPGEKEWTFILSNDLDYWGSYSYNVKNDALRVTGPAKAAANTHENFTISCSEDGKNKGIISLSWDKTTAELPFTY